MASRFSSPGFLGASPAGRKLLVASAWTAIGIAVWRAARLWKGAHKITPSPTRDLALLSAGQIAALPYPPDALPGARDVQTPYGSIHVFEFGPEDGEKVLFVHGITTPTIMLGDIALELAGRGYRVMLFDLFGRGYSDAPRDLTYDARLYTTQLMLVLLSSPLCWTEGPGFHLVGYSLGGGLCVAFARYFPHLLRSLSLVASCGLIRPRHVSWTARLLYSWGLLPEPLVRALVRWRIRPQAEPTAATSAGATDLIAAESQTESMKARRPTAAGRMDSDGDGDANGGAGFNSASISKHRPGVTVAAVVRWQMDRHAGFMHAFLSTIRSAPIYAPQPDWPALSSILAARRRKTAAGTPPPGTETAAGAGLCQGKILMVLGTADPVIIADENVADARAILGDDGVQFKLIEGGHELPITESIPLADALEGFWADGRRVLL